MNQVMLTSPEMARFNRLLASVSHGRVSVGPDPINRHQARALWAATRTFNAALEGLARQRSPQRRSHESRRGGAVFVMSAAAALSGCASLNANIKGDFACRAPGGMCAPTSKIDDQALAMISGADPEAMPAGVIDPNALPDRRLIPVIASASPARTREKVLRIVFPAHVDRSGRYREASAIHAVVERGTWFAADDAHGRASLGYVGAPQQQLAMAEQGPSLAELAAQSPEVAFHDPETADDQASAKGSVPAVNAPPVAAVKAARSKGRSLQTQPRDKRVAASGGRAVPTSLPKVTQALATAVPAVAAPAFTAPALTGPLAGVSASPADLRSAGSAWPLQAIRDKVGAIFAAKTTPARAAPGSTPATTDRPVNSPSVLQVSEVDK